MKKLILLLMITSFFVSCTIPMGHLSFVSTKDVDMGAYYVKIAERAEGRAITNIIIFVPTKLTPNTIEEAVNDALWYTGGDFMTNCKIEQKVWYIPYIYGEDILSIEGDVWKISSDDVGSINLENLKENQHLFVFNNGVLKPVKETIEFKNN